MIKTIFALLLFTIFLNSCNDKKGKQRPPQTKDTITVVKAKKDTLTIVEEKSTSEVNEADTTSIQSSNLKGTWSVKKYHSSKVYAMNQDERDEWMHRRLFISDNMHFEFEKIPTYADLFKEENSCAFSNLEQPELVEAEDYFDKQFDPVEELDVLNSILRIYKTTCEYYPFASFILTQKNQILISWDGIYFILTKDSNSVEMPGQFRREKEKTFLNGVVNLPIIGQYHLNQMKIDRNHTYGAGDSWGNITSYTSNKGSIAIDSSFHGEYGYAITHFKMGTNNSLESVHTIDWNSTPSDTNGDYIYILTERTISFKTAQPTVMHRKDTVADHFAGTGVKIYSLKKPFSKVKTIEKQNTHDYWIKQYQESWKK